ncbi:MAG: type III-B CRISPR module RAMP protein Cmr1 [Gallionella sp.]
MSTNFGKIENIIEAKFRIVTPMFLGGADQQADEIRPSSVKGMLRFWWRALNWSRYRDATDASALSKLHDEEARLFGRAANDKTGGQGVFLLSVVPSDPKKFVQGEVHPDLTSEGMAAARYLGYGLMAAFGSKVKGTKAAQLDRDCIKHDQIFTIKLKFRNQPDVSIINAIKTLGLLGGMGSRSRHGYGSLALQEIKNDGKVIWAMPTSAEAYQAEIKNLFSDRSLATQQPPFSAFSAQARIDILNQDKNVFAVLNNFGKAMLMYRSAGQKWVVLTKPSEKRFIADHNWYREKKEKDFHPRRVVFGLPHNYDSKNKSHQVNAEKHERRASPLLFHVHQVGTQFIGVSVLLYSEFLPSSEKINAGGNMVKQKIEWDVLTNFITGKVGNSPAFDAPLRFPDSRKISL